MPRSPRKPRGATAATVAKEDEEAPSPATRTRSSRRRQATLDFPVARRRINLKKEGKENEGEASPPTSPLSSPFKSPPPPPPSPSTPLSSSAAAVVPSPVKSFGSARASPLLAASPLKNATPERRRGTPNGVRRALGMLQVSSPKASPTLGKAKQALSTSLPEEGVVGREKELEAIGAFLEGAWKKAGKKRRALYISGAPGTGKTACLKHLLRETGLERRCRVVFVNCMGLGSSREIFFRVAQELDPDYDGATPRKYVEAKICGGRAGRNVLLVLDEVDQLDSRDQEVLYSVFEWPQLRGSRLSLIGIANALDLTDRILPRLKVSKVSFFFPLPPPSVHLLKCPGV